MPYQKTSWQDRSVQYPSRFTRTSDGTYDTLVPAPGTITQGGTPITAAALNNLETQYEQAIVDAVKDLTVWTNFYSGFLLSWGAYGGAYAYPSYKKDALGNVRLRGSMKGGNIGTFATLPAGLRPAATLGFPVLGWNGTTTGLGYLTVSNTGALTIWLPSSTPAFNNWVALDGITWQAEQ
jgi:hypothetical protein